MGKPRIVRSTVPFSCNVLGKKVNKHSELVIIVVEQKYITAEQTISELFLGQDFVDCPRKKDCGIYEKQENGTLDFSWSRCPAKTKYP